jgi:hypothetical protein
MIVRFRKQLIQRSFLERHHAQNLQKSVERDRQIQSLLDNRHEGVNRYGHPNLGPHGILRSPIKRLDPQVLFDPAEEKFDFPAEFVELGDGQRGQKKIVGQKSEVPTVLSVVEANPTDCVGVVGLGFEAGQGDFLIAPQVRGFVDGLRRDSARLEIRFGPDDEKGMVLMEGVESGEVQISSVQDIEGTRLEREIVEDPNIVCFSFCDMDKSWYRSLQVEESMELDGTLASAESSPGEKRQTEVDRRGIEGVDRIFEFQADVLVAVKSTGLGDEHLGKVGVDTPIAGFVCVGQVVARDAAADAHVIEPTLHGFQAGDDIAKALPISQLGEGQTEELIEARKFPDPVVPPITPDAFSKFGKRKEGHNLGEDRRLSVHWALLEGRKSADYTKSCSNRLRRITSPSSVLCA